MATTKSNSFVVDLKKWSTVMDKFEGGAFMYHTTLPTDGLAVFSEALDEFIAYGIEKCQREFFLLGEKIASLLDKYGYKSAA